MQHPHSLEIPAPLSLERTQDLGVEIAQKLDGLRCSDALDALRAAERYVLAASIAVTAQIPARESACQTSLESAAVAAE
jgi:hypothetical protein